MSSKNRIGERIKKVRRDKRLTQTEFGSSIGVKGNTVTGYENGTRVPSDSVINNICKTFHVNETWLRTGDFEVDMYVPVPAEESPLAQLFADKNCTKLEMSVLSAYFSLAANERAEFCKLIVKMFPNAVSAIIDGDPLETYFPKWEEAPSISTEESSAPQAKNVHDWTDEEMHAELQRQLDAEKEETDEPSTSFSGNSGTATA